MWGPTSMHTLSALSISLPPSLASPTLCLSVCFYIAKRGKALLKLKRPYAAKLDGDKALEINPDSAAHTRSGALSLRCGS